MADIISELKGMDDAALSAKIGLANKLAEFRKDIELADGLQGDPRKNVADKIERMLNPSIYPEEIKYAVERETAKANRKTTPSAVLSGCGCCDVLGEID